MAGDAANLSRMAGGFLTLSQRQRLCLSRQGIQRWQRLPAEIAKYRRGVVNVVECPAGLLKQSVPRRAVLPEIVRIR